MIPLVGGGATLASKIVDRVTSYAGSRLLRAPVEVSSAVTLGGLVRGRIDRIGLHARDVRVGLLEVDRVGVEAHRIRLVPGFPPHISTDRVEIAAVVGQHAVDRWTKAVALPLRLRIRDNAIVARTGLAGMRLGEMEVDLTVDGRLLRLIPRRVNLLGFDMPTPSIFQAALPLPPLPRGFRLAGIDPSEGQLLVHGIVEGIREPLNLKTLRRARNLAPGRVGAAQSRGNAEKRRQDRIDRDLTAQTKVASSNAEIVSSNGKPALEAPPNPDSPRRSSPPTWE